MIPRDRPLISALIVSILKTCVNLLRYAAVQKKEPQPEQDDPLAGLKSSVTGTLQQAITQGHTCLSLGKVIHFLCSRHRGMTEADVTSAMDQLSQSGDICCRNSMISLPHVAKAEETIAHRLTYIGSRLRRIRPWRLAKLMGAESIQLNDE
jgi:hypothetical protein